MFLLKCVVSFLCIQFCLSNVDVYRAGVVEYITKDNSFKSNKAHNEITKMASRQYLDILVLPSLSAGHQILDSTYFIPESSENTIPCTTDQFHQALRTLSCAARDASMYIVTNVDEKSTCAADRFGYFSTNLVFDRNGRIVSIYRKPIHYDITCNLTDSTSEFSTDFGVKFSHLHNEDIVLQNPEVVLLNRVKNYVLPSRYSSADLLNGIDYHTAWAYTTDANLLVSAAAEVVQESGSGVYSGRTAVDTTVVPSDGIRLYVADVHMEPNTHPQRSSSENHSNNGSVRNRRRIDLNGLSNKMLNLDFSKKGYSVTLCHGGFCCDFYVKTRYFDNDACGVTYYRLAVFSGVQEFGNSKVGLQLCKLLACSNEHERYCHFEKNNTTQITFEKIVISGNFSQDSAQFPVTLTDAILPLSSGQFTFDTVKHSRQITVNLTAEQKGLISFGIFSRDFSKDTIIENKFEFADYNTNNGTEEIRNKFYFLNSEILYEVFDYIWITLRIPIFIISIYILEMI